MEDKIMKRGDNLKFTVILRLLFANMPEDKSN
jgi:hypothetical protein